MKANVIGIGWVTAADIGRGRRGTRFAMPRGPLPALSRKDLFDDPYPRFGRLDEFSRLGLAGIALALTDAGLDRWEQKRNIGVFAGTTCGCLGTDLAYFDTVLSEGGAMASPNLFAYTLSNTFLGEAAIHFGLTGPNFVANLRGGRALECLRLGLESLSWGECPLVLAGCCDLTSPGIVSLDHLRPGAVFLVLAGEAEEGSGIYGAISLDSEEALCFDESRISDWPQLVAACLGRIRE
jgi:3-oxoacyl-[acyl-carrier-protein] synthase II